MLYCMIISRLDHPISEIGGVKCEPIQNQHTPKTPTPPNTQPTDRTSQSVSISWRKSSSIVFIFPGPSMRMMATPSFTSTGAKCLPRVPLGAASPPPRPVSGRRRVLPPPAGGGGGWIHGQEASGQWCVCWMDELRPLSIPSHIFTSGDGACPPAPRVLFPQTNQPIIRGGHGGDLEPSYLPDD
jgi:hypothetical protein